MEHTFRESDAIVSITDLKGMITDFVRISGFISEELIGVAHNAVLHPIWRRNLRQIAESRSPEPVWSKIALLLGVG